MTRRRSCEETLLSASEESQSSSFEWEEGKKEHSYSDQNATGDYYRSNLELQTKIIDNIIAGIDMRKCEADATTSTNHTAQTCSTSKTSESSDFQSEGVRDGRVLPHCDSENSAQRSSRTLSRLFKAVANRQKADDVDSLMSTFLVQKKDTRSQSVPRSFLRRAGPKKGKVHCDFPKRPRNTQRRSRSISNNRVSSFSRQSRSKHDEEKEKYNSRTLRSSRPCHSRNEGRGRSISRRSPSPSRISKPCQGNNDDPFEIYNEESLKTGRGRSISRRSSSPCRMSKSHERRNNGLSRIHNDSPSKRRSNSRPSSSPSRASKSSQRRNNDSLKIYNDSPSKTRRERSRSRRPVSPSSASKSRQRRNNDPSRIHNDSPSKLRRGRSSSRRSSSPSHASKLQHSMNGDQSKIHNEISQQAEQKFSNSRRHSNSSRTHQDTDKDSAYSSKSSRTHRRRSQNSNLDRGLDNSSHSSKASRHSMKSYHGCPTRNAAIRKRVTSCGDLLEEFKDLNERESLRNDAAAAVAELSKSDDRF